MVLLCILFLYISRKAVLLKIIMYIYTHTFLIALIQSVIYYTHMSNFQLVLYCLSALGLTQLLSSTSSALFFWGGGREWVG